MANRTLYHGDNLKFLRGINTGTMNLIYADPPFNKNKDFHATPDSIAAGAKFTDRWRWDTDVHPDWIDTIKDDWPGVWQVIEAARVASGDDMGAFLCWLGVRLMAMHRVLRDDGSLYLHIDNTADSYVRMLMDAIFGKDNFRNAIRWCRNAENLSRKKWRRGHETILFYSKSKRWVFNRLPTNNNAKLERDYRYEDNKGRYTTTSCQNNADRPNMVYEFNGHIRQWRYSRETLERLATAGELVYNDEGIPRRKRYLHEVGGTILSDAWGDINNLQSMSKERTGYPTQKPLALLERIIMASSNEGDIVLDPFAGCATTPIAAERLGRQWIGMDIWKGAHEIVLQRLQSEGLATPDGDGGQLLTFGDVHYSTAPPVRSDDKEVASKALKLKTQIPEPPGKKMSRAEMMEVLIRNNGLVCKGCNRWFDDQLYLELDHNTPRSDGGLNHISNRVLLCGPCNRIKSNMLTLSGLRRKNKELGRMAT